MIYFFFLFLTIVFFYIVGTFVVSITDFKETKPFINLTLKLLLGLISSITVFSVIVTKFNTVNNASLFILLVLIYKNYAPISFSKFWENIKKNIKQLALIIVISFVILVLQQIVTGYFSSIYYQFPFIDFSYYSMVSGKMYEYGIENIMGYLYDYDIDIKETSPYHYFELWTNSFLYFIFNQKVYFTYLYLLIPFLGVVIFSAIISLFEYLKQNIYLSVLLSFLLITITLSYYPFITSLPHPENIFYFQKSWSAFIIIPITLIFIQKKEYFNSYIFLLFLPVFNIVYTPIIAMAFLYYFFLNFKNKREIIFLVILASMVFIYMFFIYFVFNDYPIGSGGNATFIFKDYFLIFLKRFTIFKIIILYTFLYFIGLLFYYKKVKDFFIIYIKGILLCLLLIILSVFFSALLNFNEESWQFISITLGPIIICLIALMVSFLMQQNKFKYIFLVIIILVLISGFYSTHFEKRYYGKKVSKEFLKKVEFAINKYGYKNKGVFLINYNFLDHFSNPDYFKEGNLLALYLKNFSTTTLNTPVDTSEYNYSIKKYKNSPIGRFIQMQIENNSFIDMETSQRQFIEKNHINYILTYKYNLPEHLEELITDSLTDSSSGINIYFIKNIE